MAAEHLREMTQEQREAASIARQAKKAFAESNYIQSFADEPYWRQLSSFYDVRMPVRSAGPHETKYLRRVAKKVGVSLDDYVESTGFSTLKAFCTANDKYAAWVHVGLFLEFVEEQRKS